MKQIGQAVLAAALLAVAAQATAIEARIAARVAGEGPFWVGQRIVVEVDLLSNGFSFSGQRFELPDLAGVVLLPAESATLNLTERIDGEVWQGMRYELSLFVLEPGTLEVPPITAAFSVAAGYGSEPQPFRLDSAPLTLVVERPPGVAAAATLITTPAFELDARWEPPPDGLKVGDALTLTIRRRAADVPGAAIPPLEFAAPDGLVAYHSEPAIADETGRGQLIGERTDRVTFVLQAPGDYRLAGRTLQWFDPKAGTLHEEIIAPLEFSVAPNPDARTGDVIAGEVAGPAAAFEGRAWILAAAAALLVFIMTAWTAPRLRAHWRRRRVARSASEAGRFAALLAACRRDDPATADNALRAWLRSAGAGAKTATAFAVGDTRLSDAVAGLQAALAAGRAKWSGAELAAALKHRRDALMHGDASRRRRQLPPLNPLRGRTEWVPGTVS